MRALPLLALALCAAPALAEDVAGPIGDRAPVAYVIENGAGIPEPLAARGDPDRGAAIAADPGRGGCLGCHAAPGAPAPATDAPAADLTGVGARLPEARLRLAVANYGALDPEVTGHAFYDVRDLGEAASEAEIGTTALAASEIEDLVAWLVSLDAEPAAPR